MSSATALPLPAGWSGLPGHWRLPIAVVAFCMFWTVAWYHETALAMVTIWYRSDTFTHAFVVPPIVLWLVWRQRDRLANLSPRPSPWVLVPLAAVGLGWLLGQLTAVNALTQLALVASLVLIVPAVLGWRVAATIAFPLAFMFFAVPIGEFMMPRMMDWTAEVTVVALRLTGIPVYQEGLQFVIPSGRWSVVEACSGVRYMIASLTVGTLFAYLTYTSYRRRIAFIAVSILVPLFANWARAYIIVMLGHLSGNTIATGVDHLVYGWLFFGIVIMVMFMVGARWTEEPEPLQAFRGEPAGVVALWHGPATMFAVALVLLVIALPRLSVWQIAQTQTAAAAPVLEFPPAAGVGGWQQTAAPGIDWQPLWVNPATQKSVWFEKAGQRVGLYVGYYRNQNYASKLVSSQNLLVQSEDPVWGQVSAATGVAAVAGDQRPIRIAELRRGGYVGGDSSQEVRLLVWRWYWVNGRVTISDAHAKALSAWSQLTGAGDESAVVVVFAPTAQPGGAEAALRAFVAEAVPALDAALRQTGARR